MRKMIVLFGFLLSTTILSAAADVGNQAKIDSLSRVLSALTGAEKLKVYEQLIKEQEWAEDHKTNLALCDAWIDYAHLQGDIENEEKARNRKLTIIYNDEEWEQLVTEAVKQRSWMEQHGKWDSYYKAWRDICEGNSYGHKPQTALREAENMQRDAQQRHNKLGLALAYQQMGIIYDYIDQSQALNAFEKSVALLKEIPEMESNELLSGYYYMVQALDQLGKHSKELEACKRWKQTLDKTTTDKHSSKEKVHYLEYHLWNASALIGLNMFDEADKELTISEELLKDIDDVYLNYQMQVHRANLAYRRNDLPRAEAYSDLYAPMMNEDQWQLALKLRGEILLKSGRYKDAAFFYKRIFEQRDSTFTKDVRMQLDEFNSLFQIGELKMQSQLERSRFIILLVGLVVVALLIFLFFRYRASKRLQQKNQELVIANARAEESSKMKTNFIRQISHEIRTPLNILNGFTQVITDPNMKLDNAEQDNIRERISENTERITGLVNKMLELSDASSQTIIERDETVPASLIVNEAADSSNIRTATHIKFCLPDIDENILLHTNKRYAVRALVLLLDNAQKFTKSGEVRLNVREHQSTLEFIVEDTGIGIPTDKAEIIFNEFVQLDEYYDGTGIGLTVARSIARRLGGDILLDTTYSEGARFMMTLPKE